MERVTYPQLGETVLHTTLSNGLNLFVSPKKEFRKNFAFFATNYGGMDMKFTLNGVFQNTPAGIALFLEH